MAPNRKPTAALACILSLAIPVTAAPLAPTHRMDQAREQYQPSTWPATGIRPGFALGSFEFPGLRGEPVQTAVDGIVQRRLLDAKGTPRVLIQMTVSDDIPEARERLLRYLAFVSSPGTRPTAEELGFPVGDVGYVGRAAGGPGRIAWIAFERGNLVFRVVCLEPQQDPHPDLPAIARSLDAEASKVSLLQGGSEVTRPDIATFFADRAICRAGEVVPLSLQIEDPGNPTLDWSIEGLGQGYVEQEPDGRWAFHATGAGSATVRLVVTGSLGTTSQAALEIEVGE